MSHVTLCRGYVKRHQIVNTRVYFSSPDPLINVERFGRMQFCWTAACVRARAHVCVYERPEQ